uniref:Secreted protein n=1 Tax=Knipowitschia caucasica TaxID=637954 RepID=A0AAV2LJV2_KNICA
MVVLAVVTCPVPSVSVICHRCRQDVPSRISTRAPGARARHRPGGTEMNRRGECKLSVIETAGETKNRQEHQNSNASL